MRKKFNLLRSRKWYAIRIRLRNNVIKYEFMLGVDHAFITRGYYAVLSRPTKTETNVLFNPSLQMIAKEKKKNNKCCKTGTSRGTIIDGRIAWDFWYKLKAKFSVCCNGFIFHYFSEYKTERSCSELLKVT